LWQNLVCTYVFPRMYVHSTYTCMQSLQVVFFLFSNILFYN
jgi:hypothetical protein